MTNLERLQMEIQGTDTLTVDQLTVYLEENSLTGADE